MVHLRRKLTSKAVAVGAALALLGGGAAMAVAAPYSDDVHVDNEPETADDPETDDPETDDPETDDPETDDEEPAGLETSEEMSEEDQELDATSGTEEASVVSDGPPDHAPAWGFRDRHPLGGPPAGGPPAHARSGDRPPAHAQNPSRSGPPPHARSHASDGERASPPGHARARGHERRAAQEESAQE